MNHVITTCPVCSTVFSKHIAIPTRTIQEAWRAALGLSCLEGNPETVYSWDCPNCEYKFYTNVEDGDATFYNDFVTLTKDYAFPEDKEEFKFIATHTTSDDHVLDIGCGNGNLYSHVAHAASYTGIDFSSASRDLKKGNMTILTTSLEDFCKIATRKYSVVVISHILEHTCNPVKFAEQVLSLVEKGGNLIVTVPNHSSYLEYMTNITYYLPPHHVGRWTKKALLALFMDRLNLMPVEVYEEPLHMVHRKDFAKAFFDSFGFMRKPPLISNSWWYEADDFLAKALAPFISERHLGHSISICFTNL